MKDVFYVIKNKEDKMKKTLRVKIDGKKYKSIGGASKELGVPYQTIRRRCMSSMDTWKDWIMIDKPKKEHKYGIIYKKTEKAKKFVVYYKKKYLGMVSSLEEGEEKINFYKEENGIE